jgi:hypothetical protein
MAPGHRSELRSKTILPSSSTLRNGLGMPLGLALTARGLELLVNSQGGLPHFQMGVNWLALALLIPVTLVVAALGAYLPARWVAQEPVNAALLSE